MVYFIRIVFFLGILCASGCSLAPKYHRPQMDVPASYKESGKWLHAKPQSADLSRGPWWKMYNDPVLNALEEKVDCSNQTIKAALARYEQARALAKVARSAYFPTVLGVTNANRQKSSRYVANTAQHPVFNDILVTANITYEVDLWGRVRNSVAAATYTARASAADLAAINLSMHAELANNYFSLRGNDAAQYTLDQIVIMYEKALFLTKQRFKGGASPVADVDQAETQLQTAKTLAADTRLKRAQLEHAIAVLIGEPASTFSIKPSIAAPHLVTINPDLPSTLLERRPDVAESELAVLAANANIGVARAAYFPAFNLSSGIGFESSTLANLFKAPSLVWTLGSSALSILNSGNKPLLAQTIFDGGRIGGLTQEAWGKYKETAANYRQTVLTAYREVEDNLVAIRQLDRENQTQTAATRSANRALQQAMYRYKGGLITYLEVVFSQNIALEAELSSIDIRTRRQLASVELIKALGGGWERCCKRSVDT